MSIYEFKISVIWPALNYILNRSCVPGGELSFMPLSYKALTEHAGLIAVAYFRVHRVIPRPSGVLGVGDNVPSTVKR